MNFFYLVNWRSGRKKDQPVDLLHVYKVTQALSSGFVDFSSLHAWNEG